MHQGFKPSNRLYKASINSSDVRSAMFPGKETRLTKR